MLKLLNFDIILSKAISSFGKLPETEQEEIKQQINHGKAILQTQEQLDGYISLYGDIHRQKLIKAFSHIPDNVWAGNISVIDWGSGQGLAPIILQDHIDKQKSLISCIEEIVLIEPSKACLSRAETFIQWSIPSAFVYSLSEKEENITISELPSFDNTIIHILSNVVDMPDFYGENVLKYIERESHKHHVIVCVSPFYPEKGRGKYMSEFGDNLDGFKLIYKFERHRDDWTREYSCQIHIYDNRN